LEIVTNMKLYTGYRLVLEIVYSNDLERRSDCRCMLSAVAELIVLFCIMHVVHMLMLQLVFYSMRLCSLNLLHSMVIIYSILVQ